MATDIAALSIKIENGDVVKATTALNTMAVAGDKTEKATQRLTRRMALLEIEARQMDTQMAKSKLSITGLATSMGLSEAAAGKLATALGALSATAAIGFIGHKMIEETIAAQNAMAQLEAAVLSTGGAAGRTVKELDELSVALQQQTIYSDEAVKGAEAILLTFDKIKGTQFDQATKAATDLAARMGGDLPEAALKLGKALQDPEHGLAALRKAGISFTDAQVQVIKHLNETGHAAEAQAIILAELQRKFGGSAAAARDTLGGALKGLSNDFGDLFERTKEETGELVKFINATGSVIRELHNYADAAKAVALALGGVAVAYGVATIAAKSFAVQAVLGGAATAVEGLTAALTGLGAAGSVALGPIALLAGAAALAIYDLNKAFDDYDDKVEEASKNTKEYVDYLKALGRAHAHGPEAPKPEAPPIDPKFQQDLAARDLEIARQRALNGVVGATSATIALLNNAYDARAERAKNAIDHTEAETAALNKRTNALRAAKDAAVLDAQAQANRKQVADVQHGDANAVRDARQALELAGMSDEAAAQRRVDMQAENDLAEARLRFATMTRDLDKEQADVAAGILQREQDIYASTAARVEKVRELGHETASVTAEMDRQKKAQDEAAREMERRAREIRRATVANIEGILTDISNGRNPLIALADGFKHALIHAISEALAEKALASKFAAMLGLGVESAAKTQTVAGTLMVDAARMQLQAAILMSGKGVPGESTGAHGGIADASAVLDKMDSKFADFAKKAAGYAALVYGSAQAGYGAGGAVTSTSHSTAGNYARGALAGAASGAATGAAIGSVVPVVGTAIGAIVGGAVGLVAGLFGAKKAMDDLSAAAINMRKAVAVSLDAIRAEVNNDSLAAQIAQVHARAVQVAQQIEDAYSGGDKNSATVKERNRLLAENYALEQRRIEQLKEEAAAIQRYFSEDLEVEQERARATIAESQGNTAEAKRLRDDADKRAYFESQERRLDEYRRTHDLTDPANQQQYAALQYTVALNEQAYATKQNTEAINALTTSVRGGPSGFKLNGYIQQYGAGLPHPMAPPPLWTPLSPGGLTPPSSPMFSQSSANTGKVATAPITINNPTFNFPNVTDGKVAAKAFLAELDKTVAATGGLNTTRAVALNKMTVS